MSIPLRFRRPLAAAAAATLALPLTVAAVVPATAATVLVDRGWPPYPGSGFQPYGDVSPYATTASLDTTEATAEQSTGLVTITSEVELGAGEAAGTGIVIGSDGLVVTNHHVVEGATDIEVTVVSTGVTYEASVLGYDAAKDVAVLRLADASGLAAVHTDPTGLTLGEDVTAVGDVVGMNVAASNGSSDITGYVIPIKRVLRIADQVLAGDASGTVEIGYDAFLGVAMGTAEVTLGACDTRSGSRCSTSSPSLSRPWASRSRPRSRAGTGSSSGTTSPSPSTRWPTRG
jgi:S1-C subfamily serine protease